MAHKLNFKDGKASFASAKEKAWHGLGQILPNIMTAKEAIENAGLNFDVNKAPNYARIEVPNMEGSEVGKNFINIKTPSSFSTYRTDTNEIFGDKIGSKYEVVQNRDAFEFFDAIVGTGEAIYETAGALGKGETIFITAKLPSHIYVKGEEIEKYLLLTMAHDGSGAIQCLFTPTRVVCNNTLRAALRDGVDKVTIRHTKSAQENLKEAHKIMGITNKLSIELDEIFNKMSKIEISDPSVKSYIEELFPGTKDEEGKPSTKILNIREAVLDYMVNDPTQRLASCMVDNTLTAYGIYNGITGYLQHSKTFKTESDKMKSIMLGSDSVTSKLALDLAWSYANPNQF